MSLDIDIDYDAAVARIEDVTRKLQGARQDPVGRGLMDCGHYVMRKAIRNSPVDTGLMRASIIAAPPEVDTSGQYSEVVVGTDIEYAPHQEFGTRPFWPPKGALEVWARRHGISEYLVRRAIARKGIKAKRMFTRAFIDSKTYIGRRMRRAVREATKE